MVHRVVACLSSYLPMQACMPALRCSSKVVPWEASSSNSRRAARTITLQTFLRKRKARTLTVTSAWISAKKALRASSYPVSMHSVELVSSTGSKRRTAALSAESSSTQAGLELSSSQALVNSRQICNFSSEKLS